MASSIQGMVFKSLYGEPDWKSRPYLPVHDLGDGVLLYSDASYEENRLQAEGFHDVSKIDLSSWSLDDRQSQQPQTFARSSGERQKTYLKWSQSPLLEIVAGPEEMSFKLPGDFLTRRSRPFHAMIESRFEEAENRTIYLPETDSATFEQVLIWLMSPQPTLDSDLPMPTTIQIAIFATVYIVPSLLHQVIELLYKRFSTSMISRPFQWTPDLLDAIYQHTHPASLLRRFTRFTLSSIRRGAPFSGFTFTIEEWREVFEKHGELGFDYFNAQQHNQAFADLPMSKLCQFHQHFAKELVLQHANFPPVQCQSLMQMECFEDVHAAEASSTAQDATSSPSCVLDCISDRRSPSTQGVHRKEVNATAIIQSISTSEEGNSANNADENDNASS